MKKNIKVSSSKSNILPDLIAIVSFIIVMCLSYWIASSWGKQNVESYLKNQSITFCNQLYTYTAPTYKYIYDDIKEYILGDFNKEYKELFIDNKGINNEILKMGINSKYVYRQIILPIIYEKTDDNNGIVIKILGAIQYSKGNVIADAISNTTTLIWRRDGRNNYEWKIYYLDVQSDDDILEKFINKGE